MSKTELPTGLTVRYTYGLTTTTPNGRLLDKPSLITIAEIYDADQKLVAQGVAVLGPKDHFSAEVGHEVSLGRARKNLVGKFYAVEVEEPSTDIPVAPVALAHLDNEAGAAAWREVT